MKTALLYIGGFLAAVVLLVVFSVGSGLISLEYKKFFAPKFQNVERTVFENTQSYSHGKTQDLAKYFEEYNKSGVSEQESIRQLILMNFADFDAENIRSFKLRSFLTQMRGY